MNFERYGLSNPTRAPRVARSRNVFIALDPEVVAVESDDIPTPVRDAWWAARKAAVMEAVR